MMNKQEFQQTIKNMKPPKFFNAITLNEAYEAGFESSNAKLEAKRWLQNVMEGVE